jgi:uncharacterized protein (DUF4415 family)
MRRQMRRELRPLTDEEGEVRELTREDFRDMKPVREVMPELIDAVKAFKKMGRPKAETTKVHIGFRLAADVVESLKASGPGYNQRVEQALRNAGFGAAKQKPAIPPRNRSWPASAPGRSNPAPRNAKRPGRNTMPQGQGFPRMVQVTRTALLGRKRAPPSAQRKRQPPSADDTRQVRFLAGRERVRSLPARKPGWIYWAGEEWLPDTQHLALRLARAVCQEAAEAYGDPAILGAQKTLANGEPSTQGPGVTPPEASPSAFADSRRTQAPRTQATSSPRSTVLER